MNGALLAWTDRIERWPIALRVAVVAALVATVAAIDIATGPDLFLTLPYAISAMVASWTVSQRAGLATAAVAAALGFLVATSERTAEWGVLVANHLLRALSLLFFAGLTAAIRSSMSDLIATARHDAMTGVLTKQGFLDELTRARRRAERARTPLGVVYFDLDGLKEVNDRDGHAAGDVLIRRFTDRVGRHLRASDPFGRLGGDEFAVVLERAEPEVIDLVVGRILADPGLPEVSCGVQVVAGSYPSPAAMLAGADRRMYENKVLRRGISRPAI